MSPFLQLLYTLVAIFAAIGLGYVAVQQRMVQPQHGEMNGIGWFLGKIAFPLLVFKTVATAQLGSVSPKLIVACTLSKLLIAVAVFAFTFCFYRAHNGEKRSTGQRILTSTCFALFVTASNDFAVGFPVIDALYGRQKLGMDMYIAGNSVAGALLFTPTSMVLFEVGKAMVEDEKIAAVGNGEAVEKCEHRQKTSVLTMALIIAKTVLTNPIIICMLLGILYQIFMSWSLMDIRGSMHLPYPFYNVVTLFTSPFGMLALFCTGTTLQPPELHPWPFLLSSTKVVICAFLTFELATFMMPGADAYLMDFAFLYGSIPTSSAPLLFTMQFDSSAVNDVAEATLYGLILAGPVMCGCSFLMSDAQADRASLLHAVARFASVTSIWAGLGFLVQLVLLRSMWSVKCRGKVTVAIYGIAALVEGLTAFLMIQQYDTDDTTPASAAGLQYCGDPWGPANFFFTWSQNVCRVLILLLAAMKFEGWTAGPREETLGISICVLATLVLALALAFSGKVGASLLHEFCIQPNGTYHAGEFVFRIIWIAVLLLLFVMSGAGGILGPVRRMITTWANLNEASEGAPRRESGAGAPSEIWGERDIPDRLAWSLAACQGLVFVMEIVNLHARRTGHKRVGSLAVMLIFQVFFECGRSVVLLALLLFDKDFMEAMTYFAAMWRSVFGRGSSQEFEVFIDAGDAEESDSTERGGAVHERGDAEDGDSKSESSSSSE